ncbi:rubrerythrin-like domain-containing protein [Halomarina rubra]|uniref:Rubrerythrin-like domain-containing protein n=1 Tax=Halomarina rubra TaxID=2071873 RepID=A0ABD6ARF3_9EURY|nr:rubrerythrin-like domain-containing protein [Halomarina rubra]
MTHDSHSEVREPPYTYECMDCGERVEAEHQPVACRNCGGEMRNISVSSEQ